MINHQEAIRRLRTIAPPVEKELDLALIGRFIASTFKWCSRRSKELMARSLKK